MATQLILHIGQHKTGSKALQSAFFSNRKLLAEKGVFYPVLNPKNQVKAYEISHFKLFAILRHEVMQELDSDLADDYLRAHQSVMGQDRNLESLFRSLSAEVKKKKYSTVILSAEDLFDMHSAQEIGFNSEYIRSAVSKIYQCCDQVGFVPKVVVYLRRQDDLLIAHYNQYIKGAAFPELDFETYTSQFFPRLKSSSILRFWMDQFGQERVQFRPYEKETLSGGIVPNFFESVLQMPIPKGWQEPKKDIESVNATPPRDYIEFIRIQKIQGNSKNSFPQELILQAALNSQKIGLNGSEWLSGNERKGLLENLRDENLTLSYWSKRATEFYFTELNIQSDVENLTYPGLSAAKAIEISKQVHELWTKAKMNKFKTRLTKLSWIGIASLILLFFLIKAIN